MKNRGEHAALRRAPWISQGQVDFQKVVVAFQDGAVGGNVQTAKQILKAVKFRWQARCAHNANQRPAGEALLELFVIKFQAANSG